MSFRILIGLSSLALVTACASYETAPIAPSGLLETFKAQTLDISAVEADLRKLVPSAQWDGAGWDRLSLFVAALRFNPTLAEGRAHIASLEAAAKAASVGPPITLSLTAEYAGKAAESSPWLYGVTSDIPLDIGTRRSSRIDSAKLAALTGQYDYAESVWQVRMAITRAAAELMLAHREVDIGQQLRDVRARQLTALERRVAGGEAIRADLERLRADVSGDTRRLSDAMARELAAKTALADAVGVAPSQMTAIELRWPDFDAPAVSDANPAARDAALYARPDILRAITAYDQTEADLRGEVAKQWPEVHLGPGYTWERGLVKLPFTLGLALPPADLNRANITAAAARRTEAGVHLEAAIAHGYAAIDAALIELKAADAALVHLRTVERLSADHIATQADEELAKGAIDRVDWSAAKANALLVQLTEIDALRRLRVADAALEDALRRPLSGSETQIEPRATGNTQ